MIENYYVEFVEEFNSIKPINTMSFDKSIALCFENIKKVEVEEINKFCNIYNLTYIIQVPYTGLIQFFITKKD